VNVVIPLQRANRRARQTATNGFSVILKRPGGTSEVLKEHTEAAIREVEEGDTSSDD
jgi:hypothetical protein